MPGDAQSFKWSDLTPVSVAGDTFDTEQRPRDIRPIREQRASVNLLTVRIVKPGDDAAAPAGGRHVAGTRSVQAR